MIPTNTKDKIVAYSKELRLPAIRNNYATHARQAVKAKTSYEEYLLTLLADEFETRIKNRKKARTARLTSLIRSICKIFYGKNFRKMLRQRSIH